MIHFESDYTEGAHFNILKRMMETNEMQTIGYGEDEICKGAKEKIKKAIGREDVDIHFLVGGTQANLTVISSVLRPYQGVLSAVSGHINVHETGAIEACGHKVLALESEDGTITGEQVEDYVKKHDSDTSKEQTVQPGMVYISFPTENGTLYSKKQLIELHEVCLRYHLPLFIDGARLGYGLMSEKNDCTIEDIAKNCEVFYIGGTKVGALFGEAVVIAGEKLKKDFRYMIKQKGGMLAKGRLLGIQFDELFTNDLYFDLSKHAIDLAMDIKNEIEQLRIPFAFESWTNQQFILLNDEKTAKLEKDFCLSHIGKKDGLNVLRICTSWATKKENVELLKKALRHL